VRQKSGAWKLAATRLTRDPSPVVELGESFPRAAVEEPLFTAWGAVGTVVVLQAIRTIERGSTRIDVSGGAEAVAVLVGERRETRASVVVRVDRCRIGSPLVIGRTKLTTYYSLKSLDSRAKALEFEIGQPIRIIVLV